MIKIRFAENDKELFSNFYVGFISSDRIPRGIEELPMVLRILNGMQEISDPIPMSRLRTLKPGRNELSLHELDVAYLKEAISPPHGKWTNDGIPILMEILNRLKGEE